MNINDILQSAISLSEKYKTSAQTEQLRSLAEAIKQEKLKVVVLGDFKAGKSTLLNRLFIRKDMLPTDHLEATAVPTHLSNGPVGMNTWMRNPDGEDVLVTERRTFSDADVAATVTASSEADRAIKAQRYSRVNITMPGILPENITLVDTPGLNTTNTAIYTGTLEEARTADAILYVVRGKQLSAREEAILLDLAGSQRLKVPVHVVLTHDAAANISTAQQQNICQAIKAQLKLNNIDCGVSIFALDGCGSLETTAPITNRIDTSYVDDFGFGFAPVVTHAPAVTEVSASAFCLEDELLAFFNGEVRRGRTARIARELTPVLLALKTAVQARLSLAGANESEIARIEADKKNIRDEYLRVVRSLLLDVRTAQAAFGKGIEKDLDELSETYINKINAQQKAGDVLVTVSTWHQDIPGRLQRCIAHRKNELELDITRIFDKHVQDMKSDLEKNLVPGQVDTSMPSDWLIKFINMVPNWAIIVSDYLICDLLSPLPIWMDAPLRMLAEKIPVIKELLPTNIVAALARKMVIRKLTDCIREVQEQMRDQLDSQFAELNKKLARQLEDADIFAEQDAAIAAYRNGTLTADQKLQLQGDMEQIDQWNLNI